MQNLLDPAILFLSSAYLPARSDRPSKSHLPFPDSCPCIF